MFCPCLPREMFWYCCRACAGSAGDGAALGGVDVALLGCIGSVAGNCAGDGTAFGVLTYGGVALFRDGDVV